MAEFVEELFDACMVEVVVPFVSEADADDAGCAG